MLAKLTTYIPKILLFLIVLLVGIYFTLTLWFFWRGTDLTLEATVNSPSCNQSQWQVIAQSSLSPKELSTVIVPLQAGKHLYTLPLDTTFRTIRWQFCPEQTITLTSLKFIHHGQPIELSPTDAAHLLCIGCQSQNQKDGSVIFTPDPSKVTLQIGGIHQIVSLYYQAVYKYYYYLPQLILIMIILYCLVSVVPLTVSRLSFIIVSLIWFSTLVYFWPKLRQLFPAAKFQESQLIAAAHYLGYSLRADQIIMGILLLGFIVIAWVFKIRRRHL
ncbi:hypothetical protein A2W24_05575 [Microgenomates group bacterium RBG_16_45_19]|nr:MAG: hypothetical protein A2W24_05575 [Microgenomates group bacterium RBG_16_45_19]